MTRAVEELYEQASQLPEKDRAEQIDRAWYRERSESAEASFLRELDHAIQQVTEAPAQWPRYLASTQRYVFPTYPYSLVYFVEEDVIRVVAVAHDKKRLSNDR